MLSCQILRARLPARAVLVALALAAFAPPAGLAAATSVTATSAPAPIEVKVVVVTMFEIGADTGDTPGEFQLWHERQKLDERFPFAHHHDLFLNRQTGVLGMVTGEGTANSATAVMELGMDPRLDALRQTTAFAEISEKVNPHWPLPSFVAQ